MSEREPFSEDQQPFGSAEVAGFFVYRRDARIGGELFVS